MTRSDRRLAALLTCVWLAPAPLLAARIASADDPHEPNDSYAQAMALPLGSHALVGEDDDWFVLPDVPPGFVYVASPQAGTSINVFLWRAGAANPAGACTGPNGCLSAGPFPIVYPLVETTTLYVQVEPVNLGASYQLTVDDTIDHPGDDAGDAGEGDDSFATPRAFPSATFDLPAQRAFDVDFYAFPVLPGQLSLCLEFDPNAGDIVLELYDDTGLRIDSSDTPGKISNGSCIFGEPPRPSNTIRKLERGIVADAVLYAAVRGTAGNAYRLTADLPTQWVKRLPFGPIRRSSITLADLDGDGDEEILVGTSKGLDAGLNEVRPAALLALDGDGTLLWSYSPPPQPGPDPVTGKAYATSSVSTTPAVGDIDGDGGLEVVFGTGADAAGELLAVHPTTLRPGQPGDRGAVIALEADGTHKWTHVSDDRIGAPAGCDGIPDGVYATPVIEDLEGDGSVEVVVGGWDQRVWILDGETGVSRTQGPVNRIMPCSSHPDALQGTLVFDTIWSSPALADLDEDGAVEILIGSDQSENPEAGTNLGGVFHVIRANGFETVPGFDAETNVAPTNPAYDAIYGKLEEQAVWSSPAAADFDGNGRLEIAYGTSFFSAVPSTRGRYVRVWNHDGSPFRTFPTTGQTFASPLFADLDGDGDLELVAADMQGHVYAWDRDSPAGVPLFDTVALPFAPGQSPPHPILGSPLAVDLNGDDRLEILFSQRGQIVVLAASGVQLSDPTRLRLAVNGFEGSPAVGDVNRDRVLDVIAAGSVVGAPPCGCPDDEAAIVFAFRWDNSLLPEDSSFRFAKRMFRAVPEPHTGLLGAAVLGTLVALRRVRRGRG